MTRSFQDPTASSEADRVGNIVSLAAFRRKKQRPGYVATDAGSAWYHEAAVKNEHVRPTNVP